MNKQVENAFNEQINKEFYSAYLYLAMSAYFQRIGLSGFANWMKVQFEEEQFHAQKMFDFVHDRNGSVILEAIEKPKTEWSSALDVFEEVARHEAFVTSCIYKLADIADENKDRATASFLQWFIDEQVEEEATAGEIVNRLKLIGNDGNAIYLMDKEFETRVFTPPVA